MKYGIILFAFTAAVFLIIADVGAAPISWTDEDHWLTAEAQYYDGDAGTDYEWIPGDGSPPVSVSAEKSTLMQQAEAHAGLSTTGTDSFNMYLNASGHDNIASSPYGSYVQGIAYNSFDAKFTVIEPVLVFDYDIVYSLYAEGFGPGSYAYNEATLEITLSDGTDGGSPIFNKTLVNKVIEANGMDAAAFSDVVTGSTNLNVTVGNVLRLFIEVTEDARAEIGGAAGTTSVDLDFSLSQIPEPGTAALISIGVLILMRIKGMHFS